MTEKYLCDVSDLEEDEIKRFVLDDEHKLAAYLVDSRVYVTDDKCTHGDASLADVGSLDGCVVECGLHLGTFDIRTGEVLSAPCSVPLRTYPVIMRGNEVWVDLEPHPCNLCASIG